MKQRYQNQRGGTDLERASRKGLPGAEFRAEIWKLRRNSPSKSWNRGSPSSMSGSMQRPCAKSTLIPPALEEVTGRAETCLCGALESTVGSMDFILVRMGSTSEAGSKWSTVQNYTVPTVHLKNVNAWGKHLRSYHLIKWLILGVVWDHGNDQGSSWKWSGFTVFYLKSYFCYYTNE